MTKKLLLLILALPLVMMISLFTTTNSVSLAINVPVSGIDIIGSNIIYLNLDQAEKYQVNYTVYPTNAYNKEVTFETEVVGDAPLADLAFVDGYIVPKSVGMAKVFLTTVDGGYQDSFIVQVDSKALQEIISNVDKKEIYTGDTAVISTSFIPNTANNKLLTYTSSDESVASVNERGIVTALRKGNVTITIASTINSKIFDTVDIKVLNREAMDLGLSNITTWNSGNISISVDDETIPFEITYELLDKDGDLLSNDILEVALTTDKKNLEFNFIDDNFFGSVIVEVIYSSKNGLIIKKECKITRVKAFDVVFEKTLDSCKVGDNIGIYFDLLPANSKVIYEVSVDSNAEVSMFGNLISFTALKAGISTVNLIVRSVETPTEFKEIQMQVAIASNVFNIEEMANSYGIEKLWTIGNYNADGSNSTFQLHLSYMQNANDTSKIDNSFIENLSWECDVDPSQVTISKTGVIDIIDDTFVGLVNFYGVFEYEGVEIARTSPLSIRCIGNGVNINNYADLLRTTTDGKVAVLQNNIIDDFGVNADGSMVYKLIETTYDKTYYENLADIKKASGDYETAQKILDSTKVKVLLEFKNDLYGNGFIINADKVATKLDSTGAPDKNKSLPGYFEGPLNFVAMSPNLNSSISVKAQDNICFAVYDDVKINNVELIGCNLSVGDTTTYDLTDLNYAGTTVEVFGDNVEISCSRISNGRTVLRIFGAAASTDPKNAPVTHVNIKNSVLSNAREFIIRMGTNAFKNGSTSEPSVSLDYDSKYAGVAPTAFPVQKVYSQMNQPNKDLYDEAFIKTFVNVSSTAFRNSGIFSVGIDSHFSGTALADGSGFVSGMLDGWYNLAKTSYGAKLTFEDEVRIYDWKDLANVDSSTLIDMQKIDADSPFATLKFDVREMVEKISLDSRFSTILTPHKGSSYVHGGIAIFGGGKNYGVFEQKGATAYGLLGYEISLTDVGKDYLKLAAGEQSFYFMLHNSTSTFSPAMQDAYLSTDGNAYGFIYPKNN